MDKQYILVSLSLVVIFIVLFMIFIYQNMRREYQRYVNQEFELNAGKERGILTLDDIRCLPKPVQKYLIYAGAIGKEKVGNVKVIADGEIKLGPKASWVKTHFEQYDFFHSHLARLFYIKIKIFGVPVLGLHSYTDKSANMLIKIAGLIPVVNVGGREMRISDTVTLFNDMCIFAPASLIDKRIQWEPMDDHTVKAFFKTNDCTVSAVLYFSDQGEMINFISDDRYYLEENGSGSFKKIKWSTPIHDYQDRSGLKLGAVPKASLNGKIC